jgi:hypothetical protein
MVFSSLSSASAEKDVSMEIGQKMNVNNVIVTKFDDGRIKGIEKPEKLTKVQREEILKLMWFKEEDLKDIPESLQNEILLDGGFKVDVEKEDMLHVYTDLNGVDHVVTKENAREIEKIKNRDYKKITSNKGQVTASDTTIGTRIEGDFTGNGIITYIGKTSKGLEYIYKYRTKFK